MYTIRGQVGYAFNNFLLVGSLGVGIVQREGTVTPVGGPAVAHDETHLGVVATIGGEWAFSSNWSARGEYLYGNFETKTYTGPFANNVDFDLHVVRGALIWRIPVNH